MANNLPFVESFYERHLAPVVLEALADTPVVLIHGPRQEEIDFLLEDRRGRVAGIEVKASTSVTKGDFRHLATLRDELGERFLAGILLYTGTDTLPFGERLVAAPISALWSA